MEVIFSHDFQMNRLSPETQILLQKAKMGAMMGASVGMTMGLLFGGYSVLRYGPQGKGYIKTVGSYMFQSGASFAFFLSIGSCLR